MQFDAECIAAIARFLFLPIILSCVFSSSLENYCDGNDGVSLYPYDCHSYITCSHGFAYRSICPAKGCPLFINGTFNNCDKCSTNCP